MTKQPYKILVLSDLKEQTNYTLRYALELTASVEAEIHFFHVRPLIEVIGTTSQLSAMRTLSSEYITTEKKMSVFLDAITETYSTQINKSFVFGNVKSEIKNFITNYAPDIIVIGSKKRKKKLTFLGDNVTNLVVKTHLGPVLIASREAGFKSDSNYLPELLKHESAVIEI